MNFDLTLARENAIGHLGNSKEGIALGDWDEFRHNVRTACEWFLILAAASLLVDMKPKMFFTNLSRAAENWRRFFVVGTGHFGMKPGLTFHTPLHAAIIVGDEELVSKLPSALPLIYEQGMGYSDPFHTCWLQLLLSNRACAIDDRVMMHLSMLQRSEQNGINSTLFKALLSLDELTEPDFWSTFETALYTHEIVTEARAQSFTTQSTFVANRFIWYEGLVWLTLARRRGFTQPSSAYKYCPAEALLESPKVYDTDDWILVQDPEN